jgi:hypothetical protein
VRVATFAALVPLLLRLGPDRLGRVLDGRIGRHRPRPVDPERIVAHLEQAMRGRPIVRRSCLTRGLTMYWFLRRGGLPVRLHFGMGQVGDVLEGHCWIERDGAPFLEPYDPRPTFTGIYSYPVGSSAWTA